MNMSYKRNLGKRRHACILACLHGVEGDTPTEGVHPNSIERNLKQLYGITKCGRQIAGTLDYMVKLGYARRLSSRFSSYGFVTTAEGHKELDRIADEDKNRKEDMKLLRFTTSKKRV